MIDLEADADHPLYAGEDFVEGSGAAAIYLDQSGTMVIDATPIPNTGDGVSFSLADVTFVEIDEYSGMPISGGACLHVASADLSADGPECPNGVAEVGEECDGVDLNGQTCTGLGYTDGGTLGCEEASCTFDTSACEGALWTCDPSYLSDGEWCDCECGSWDPDCDVFAGTSTDTCDWYGMTCVSPGVCE
jgi:hypothetical protein